MATDLRFSGQAAQLGRPGVVKDVSNKLVGQFAECIKGQLSAAPEERAAAVEEGRSAEADLGPVARGRTRWWGRSNECSAPAERGGRPREAHHRHRQRRPARGGRRGAGAARLLPARGSRPHRHDRRLRHDSSCGACTVHVDGESVKSCNRPRGPGRRRRGHHHRGPRDQRRAPPDAGRLPGAPRPAVRLLHARDDHGGRRAPEREPEPHPRPRSATASRATLCRCTGYQNIVKAVSAVAGSA